MEPVSPLTCQTLEQGAVLARIWKAQTLTAGQFFQLLLKQARKLQSFPEMADTPLRQIARSLLWEALDQSVADGSAATGPHRTSYTFRETTIERFFRLPETSLDVISGQEEMQSQPVLFVVSGIPGSGKSTWIETQLAAKDNQVVCVSTDELRASLLGDAKDQSRNAEIFALAYRAVRQQLRQGCSVVFDATGILRKHRSVAWRIATTCHARRVAVVFDTPLQIALARNQNRARTVPDEVVTRFFLQWQRPNLTEADERIIISQD
ncbi:MAG: AAA family ATPase [Blastocatellia bacterium]|nr:AAA family ATPase [Blastocatellia bacterium]